MAFGVATVWVPVDDMARAVDFYSDTLGLSVKMRTDEWTEIDANGLTIGLNAREGTARAHDGGAVITFQPEGSLDDEVSRLQGVDFADGITDQPWGRIAAFHDPDGNVLELYEPPSD